MNRNERIEAARAALLGARAELEEAQELLGGARSTIGVDAGRIDRALAEVESALDQWVVA